jgi:biotin-dependent carboxylase-like uncharacterized protein
LATGPLTTIQDLGRVGYAHLGVGRSGAADPVSLAAANRLVGNPDSAAGFEVTLGGLELQLLDAATIAITGARGPATVAIGVAVSLPAGTRVGLAMPTAGLRSYVAIRGGLDVAPVLGSRATDTLSGLGPPIVRVGDELAIGTGWPPVSDAVIGSPARRALRIVAGPRDDWFEPQALSTLTSTPWTVRPDSDRIGLRLDGPALPRIRAGELQSEATLPGALQVPPDGRPILLGPDAPVTGGYPVLAVVHSADTYLAGQLRPGDTVRFQLMRFQLMRFQLMRFQLMR